MQKRKSRTSALRPVATDISHSRLFDPTATLAALSGSALDAGFNPYQRICLNR
jgi:hypothetical protein